MERPTQQLTTLPLHRPVLHAPTALRCLRPPSEVGCTRALGQSALRWGLLCPLGPLFRCKARPARKPWIMVGSVASCVLLVNNPGFIFSPVGRTVLCLQGKRGLANTGFPSPSASAFSCEGNECCFLEDWRSVAQGWLAGQEAASGGQQRHIPAPLPESQGM